VEEPVEGSGGRLGMNQEVSGSVELQKRDPGVAHVAKKDVV
jgi:hypothetical protein